MSARPQKLIFATGNPNKVAEVRALCPPEWEVISLADLGYHEELAESGNTLEANALEKATFVSALFGLPCFSEDTGLEIERLGNEPGVHSARYAGPGKVAEDNMNQVLLKLEGEENRNARFRAVIALVNKNEKKLFEGVTYGTIERHKVGNSGFGYDPIFKPAGSDKTYGEMTMNEKNAYNHRRKAFEKLIVFLKSRSSSIV